MVNPDLLERLSSLRNLRLRQEVLALKSKASALARERVSAAVARAASLEALSSPGGLADLDALGDARLSSQRRAKDLKREVEAAAGKVDEAHRLRDVAEQQREQQAKFKRRSREQSFDLESATFLAWQSGRSRKE